MASKKNDPNAQLFKLAADDAGKSTAKELARSMGMKEPNFLAAVTKYAVENGLAMPKMAFEKSKTTVKQITRRRTDCDIRISHFRLANAGMAETTAFKLIAGDGEIRIIPDKDAAKAAQGRVKSESKNAQIMTEEKAKVDAIIEKGAKPAAAKGSATRTVGKKGQNSTDNKKKTLVTSK